MKHFFIVFYLSVLTTVLPIVCFAQETINGSIMHDDIERDYILYQPAGYTGDDVLPLVLNFHGYGSTAAEQMNYGDFRSIADSAGFFIVHPQGTLLGGITHWNVGGWTVGSTVDDVGFTEALIDSLSEIYNIDPERIYSTGMSNGGFMSFLLASQLSSRIAAIASVSGSMTPETYNESNPLHPIPILQMHGSADGLVYYNGTSWSEPIEDVLQYWVDYNNCNITPIISTLPDLDPNDGSTVELQVYNDGDNGVAVEHYKVIGGGHTWPGNAYASAGTNNDIDASVEIWNFLSKYDINGLINPVGIEAESEIEIANYSLNNYPNPFNPSTLIKFSIAQNEQYELMIYNLKGQKIRSFPSSSCQPDAASFVNIGDMQKPDEARVGNYNYSITWNGKDDSGKPVSSGIYFCRLKAGEFSAAKKMLLLK